MHLKITEKKEENLLSRTAIKASVTFDKATPSNEEIKKTIASELKADENLVVVKEIYTDFGNPEADVKAYVYTSKEEMGKIEPKPKKKEKPGTQTSKSESDSAQKKKKEKPVEKKAEEKPVEAAPKAEEAPKE